MPSPCRSLAAALLSASLACAPARAQGPDPGGPPAGLPATAAGALGRGVVDAINDPDTAAIARFLDRVHAPAAGQPRAELEAMLRGIRAQGGRVTPRGARQAPDGALVLPLLARGGQAGVALRVAPWAADSARLDRVGLIRPFRTGDEMRPLPRERLADAEMLRRVDGELRRLEALDRLSGVVLVGRGDRILYEGTFGVEDPRTGARTTTRSRFHTASVPKMLTAVAIGQLVEAGRLSFDDTLGELLPEQPWTEPARAITLRQLLTHHSGIGRAPAGLPDPPTAAEHVAAFAGQPLLFAPGERMSYSNEGFITLAAVVEKASGVPFDRYMDERVLRPAGMHTMRYAPTPDSLTDRAFPSPRQEHDYFGVLPRRALSRGWGGGGAGGGHASARDLFAFYRALLGGRLVGRETLDTLLTPRAPWDGGQYGYGFTLWEANGRKIAGHRGGGPPGMGLCNDTSAFLDGSYTVVVLTNYDAPFCATVKENIVAMLAHN